MGGQFPLLDELGLQQEIVRPAFATASETDLLRANAFYTEALRDRSRELGIADADTTLKLNKPELRVDIDRDRAADLGVSSRDIGTALRLMVGGDTEVSRFRDESTNEDYDIQLRLTETDRNDPNEIPHLYLPRKDGGLGRRGGATGGLVQFANQRIGKTDGAALVALQSRGGEIALLDRQFLRDQEAVDDTRNILA